MIGGKIKLIRKSYNITLKELSNRTGLSVSFLSNIERNTASPTLEHLQLLCNALEVDMLTLLQEAMLFSPVTRANERKSVYTDSYRTKYASLCDPNQKIKATVLTIESDYFGEEISYGHCEDELDVIVEGSMVMTIREQEYVLNEGDTIYIKANSPHRFRKISESRCVLYCIKA